MINTRVLNVHKHLPDCPGQEKVILKDQERTVARTGQAKIVLWTYDFQSEKNNIFFFWGQVKL